MAREMERVKKKNEAAESYGILGDGSSGEVGFDLQLLSEHISHISNDLGTMIRYIAQSVRILQRTQNTSLFNAQDSQLQGPTLENRTGEHLTPESIIQYMLKLTVEC